MNSPHTAQFYESSDCLVESVSKYVLSGLRAGEGAVVIATAEHLRALRHSLRSRALPFGNWLETGQLVLLDAHSTLSKLLLNDMPNQDLFNNLIASLVDSMSVRFKGVRAYGEMVNLLWAERDLDATVKLEKFWNELGQSRRFSLLCGYSLSGFNQATDVAAMREICCTHSHVIAGQVEKLVAPARPNLDISNLRVLLVDDSEDNLYFVSRLLMQEGCRVMSCSDGRSALFLAKSQAFDVVLMDIQMPGMDGFEVLRALRSSGSTKPVIALTALTTTWQQDEFRAAGFNGFVGKPVDRSRLREEIARHVPSLD